MTVIKNTVNIQEGYSYMLRTQTPKEMFLTIKSIFLKRKTLVITRLPQEEVFSILGKKDVRSIWLTNVPSDKPHVRPMEVEQLCYDVEQFMKQNSGSVVLFSAVEYLISFSTFTEIFHLLQNLRDFALIHKTILVLNIGKGTLDIQQEKLFLQEFIVLEDED